ncbi:hypothetical protein RRG08_027449 [Elysia crispata]|uniref:Uncharacterized protein n=1 Tax=Elysia crispata TaxID=231223 RepID=A0AAE0YSV2_9GAST|nr:hypothetical protein RRG08_027449 [Elysia crispata]
MYRNRNVRASENKTRSGKKISDLRRSLLGPGANYSMPASRGHHHLITQARLSTGCAASCDWVTPGQDFRARMIGHGQFVNR